MKQLFFYIFLLTFDLFARSQGLPIGYVRGCNQRYLKSSEKHMRKSLKTPWKPDKHDRPRSIEMVTCECPVPHQPGKTVNYLLAEDDPEKWFVKVYQVPDTRPQRYILCSVRDDTEPSKPPPGKSMDVSREFKKCILQCDDDWLILRCIPHAKICPRVSRKNCASVFFTKFLQINEPEKLKNSVLSVVFQGKCPRRSTKK